MILTTHLDESGTHAGSRIRIMAGYVGTASEWKHFEEDWAALVAEAGVRHIHAVDLFKRTKQFKDWKSEDVDTLAVSLDSVIARHLKLGFSVIVRDDDYRNIYGAGPHPKRPPKDTKYGVCFRACLAFVPSLIASEIKLIRQTAIAEPTTLNLRLKAGIQIAAIRGGSLVSTRETRYPNRGIWSERSIPRQKIASALRLRIFLPTPYIGRRFLSMVRRHRLSRGRPTSPIHH
jgi:hypothetical protein